MWNLNIRTTGNNEKLLILYCSLSDSRIHGLAGNLFIYKLGFGICGGQNSTYWHCNNVEYESRRMPQRLLVWLIDWLMIQKSHYRFSHRLNYFHWLTELTESTLTSYALCCIACLQTERFTDINNVSTNILNIGVQG